MKELNREEEQEIVASFASGQLLQITNAGVMVAPDNTAIVLLLLDQTGKRYLVPFPPHLALSVGEALVRTVDAMDAGLTNWPDIDTPDGLKVGKP
jgi:hypothetical protein